MTTPAITIPGQRNRLTFATGLGKCQQFVTVPYAAAECTEAIALTNKDFATADAVIQRVVNCDGRALVDAEIRSWEGSFRTEFFGTSRWLGWGLAMAWGTAADPDDVAQSDMVATLTIAATGGTQRFLVEGKKTAAVAYNAAFGVIQTAVDNAVGASRWTIAGTGASRTFTAGGALAGLELAKPQVIGNGTTLTGGTNSFAVTTPGGPDRFSYDISQSGDDQPPSTTAILGYQGVLAVRLADLTVDTLTVERQDSGLYLVGIDWKWSGIFETITGYTFPGCTEAKTLKTRDGGLKLGATDHSRDLRVMQYTFSNQLQALYVDESVEPQALIRDFGDEGLENTWSIAVEETPSVATSVYNLVTASNGGAVQSGTKNVDMDAQVGSLSDGAVLSSPQSWVRLDGSVQIFRGTPERGHVPAAIESFNGDSDPLKPVSAVVITDYADGYLDPI